MNPLETPEQRIAEIEKELLKVSIIDAPGVLMLGLGLYGKFGADGNAFHPLLNNPDVYHGLLVVGAAIAAWCAYKFIRLSKEKLALERKELR